MPIYSLDNNSAIGTLGDFGGGLFSLASRGSNVLYYYGYPAHGVSEPNVAEQWLFNVASGNLTGQVASTLLSVVGSPTFSVSAPARWGGIIPGITYAAGARHQKTTATSVMDFTNQHVVELWFAITGTTGTVVFWDTEDTSFVDGAYCAWQRSTNNLQTFFKATDTTTVQSDLTMSAATYADGNPHKIRLKINFSGNLEALVDGNSLGTTSLAALAGKTVNCDKMTVGAFADGSVPMTGTIFELRKSDNLTNNSNL